MARDGELELQVSADVAEANQRIEELTKRIEELEAQVEQTSEISASAGDQMSLSFDSVGLSVATLIASLKEAADLYNEFQDLVSGGSETLLETQTQAQLIGITVNEALAYQALLEPTGEDLRALADLDAQFRDRFVDVDEAGALTPAAVTARREFNEIYGAGAAQQYVNTESFNQRINQVSAAGVADFTDPQTQALLDRLIGGDRRVLTGLNLLAGQGITAETVFNAQSGAGVNLSDAEIAAAAEQAILAGVDENIALEFAARGARSGKFSTRGSGLFGVPAPLVGRGLDLVGGIPGVGGFIADPFQAGFEATGRVNRTELVVNLDGQQVQTTIDERSETGGRATP